MAFAAHKIIKLFFLVTKSFTYFLRLFQNTKTTTAGKVIELRDQGNNRGILNVAKYIGVDIEISEPALICNI